MKEVDRYFDAYDLGMKQIEKMNDEIYWLENQIDRLSKGEVSELLVLLLDYDLDNEKEWAIIEEVFGEVLKHPRVNPILEKAIEQQAHKDYVRERDESY